MTNKNTNNSFDEFDTLNFDGIPTITENYPVQHKARQANSQADGPTMSYDEFRSIFRFEETYDKITITSVDCYEKPTYKLIDLVNKINKVPSKITIPAFINNKQIYLPNDCTALFSSCKFTEIDLSQIQDTSNITSMENMFAHCEQMKKLNLTNFNTSNVKTMKCRFNGCKSLLNLDLSYFNTENVGNMKFMFTNCTSLEELDLSSFDTSKVLDMAGMFFYCTSLRKLKLSNFDTTHTSDMTYMFTGCKSLTELDLSSFANPLYRVLVNPKICYMFGGCYNLKTTHNNFFDKEFPPNDPQTNDPQNSQGIFTKLFKKIHF